MIKKVALSMALPIYLMAIEMPPMPSMDLLMKAPQQPAKPVEAAPQKAETKVVEKKASKDSNKRVKEPNECDVVPPMLYMLPPPLKSAVDKCTATLNIPKKEAVKTKLEKNLNKSIIQSDKKVEVTSIEALENLSSIYEIEFKVGKETNLIYCNSNLSICFEKIQYLK